MNNPILATRDLCKNFGALITSDHVSIDLMPNEIHALIGPNGAGKSTLIAQICGSLKPTSGSVEFLRRDVTGSSARERARAGLARTFQVSALAAEDTVLQNAVLGIIGATGKPWSFFRNALNNPHIREQAEAALLEVGLQDQLHNRVDEISHGQRRLLEVAVALTLNPKAFVMDEPMAGVGSEGSGQLTDLFGRLRERAPILLVEHDMDVVFALADRVSVLVYGKIIASGTVDEIRQDQSVQEAYLGAPA